MSYEDEKTTGLVPSTSSALSRVESKSLVQRGMQDWLAAEEAERWLNRGLELLAQRKFDEIFACFERGLKILPQDAKLQYYVGRAYEWGHGVPEDRGQAALFFRKAAEQGLASAQNDLAFAYECGRGVPKDDNQAAFWYRKAADQGDADSQFMLAVMYQEGRGVPYNPEQAVFWFRESAEQDDAGAQIMLGGIYEAGEFVPQDYAQAAYWYLKVAVRDGWETIQRRLGQMYENGLGVPRNLEQAVYWYRKAAEQGDEPSKAALATMRR